MGYERTKYEDLNIRKSKSPLITVKRVDKSDTLVCPIRGAGAGFGKPAPEEGVLLSFEVGLHRIYISRSLLNRMEKILDENDSEEVIVDPYGYKE